jgi:hypothetical protein
MKQVQILGTVGNKYNTSDGLKIAIGNGEHRIGSVAWCYGDYLIGGQQASGRVAYVPTKKPDVFILSDTNESGQDIYRTATITKDGLKTVLKGCSMPEAGHLIYNENEITLIDFLGGGYPITKATIRIYRNGNLVSENSVSYPFTATSLHGFSAEYIEDDLHWSVCISDLYNIEDTKKIMMIDYVNYIETNRVDFTTQLVNLKNKFENDTLLIIDMIIAGQLVSIDNIVEAEIINYTSSAEQSLIFATSAGEREDEYPTFTNIQLAYLNYGFKFNKDDYKVSINSFIFFQTCDLKSKKIVFSAAADAKFSGVLYEFNCKVTFDKNIYNYEFFTKEYTFVETQHHTGVVNHDKPGVIQASAYNYYIVSENDINTAVQSLSGRLVLPSDDPSIFLNPQLVVFNESGGTGFAFNATQYRHGMISRNYASENNGYNYKFTKNINNQFSILLSSYGDKCILTDHEINAVFDLSSSAIAQSGLLYSSTAIVHRIDEDNIYIYANSSYIYKTSTNSMKMVDKAFLRNLQIAKMPQNKAKNLIGK